MPILIDGLEKTLFNFKPKAHGKRRFDGHSTSFFHTAELGGLVCLNSLINQVGGWVGGFLVGWLVGGRWVGCLAVLVGWLAGGLLILSLNKPVQCL